MKVAIFNDVATTEIIEALKAEGEKYQGLYVDMSDPKQRKYVKDNASNIKRLKKQVDRKRIDVVKEFKARVEKEAANITEDLNIANLPFESLIDEYTIERKKVLDAEKADREAREMAAQIEVDHEFGLLMNDKFDADKIAAQKERLAYEEKLKADAIEQAKVETEQQRIEREASKVHLAKINNGILGVLMFNGIDEDSAKMMIRLAAKGELPKMTINY